MTEKRLTSELVDYQRIQLGEVEKGFIFQFSFGSTTAYGICRKIEEMECLQKKVPVSYENIRKRYKNVFKRVVRLRELGLIEELEGKFPRGDSLGPLASKFVFGQLYFVRIELQCSGFSTL